jgi:hypothetical protein
VRALPRGKLVIAAVLALLPACRNEIWLSDRDGNIELDAGGDAHVVRPPDASLVDAGEVDGGEMDGGEIDVDSGTVGRGCELTPVPIVVVGDTGPLEAPTLAVSGRLATLRYGLLVPPAASLVATDETQLVVLDDEGVVLLDRGIRLEDGSGAVTSTATLHSLSPLVDEEGFLLLTPRGIWMLDADGAGASETATLTTPPSSLWQRSAGWIDADRFAFVSDTADLRVAVFDRRTGDVTTTSISALGAGGAHLEPGGATLSSAGPTNEIVVYDPDLSGLETLRTTWEDGSPLGTRLLGVGLFGGERTWLVRTADEFRTNVVSYRVTPGEPPAAGASTPVLGPLTATREGPFLAIMTETPSLVLYAFDAHSFSTVAMSFGGDAIVEHERDGASVSILFLEPVEPGRASLELACGRP